MTHIYSPALPWSQYDFEINKVYWETHSSDAADVIRLSNLCTLRDILNKHGIQYWLFGQTLSYAVRLSDLSRDHDDDIGIHYHSLPNFRKHVIQKLLDLNFVVVRDTKNIISVCRDYRYIDVCIFRPTLFSKSGYSTKFLDSSFLRTLETTPIKDQIFSIPSHPHTALHQIYPIKYPEKLKVFLLSRLSFDYFNQLRFSIIQKFKFRLNYLIFFIAPYLSGFVYLLPGKKLGPFKYLSKTEFLRLQIEPKDSFNWNWRYRHLSVVTNNCKLSFISDIVEYLSNPTTFKHIESTIIETDTTIKFHSKSNLDYRFWWSGNNFFWNCVKYQYRKDVLPYSKISSLENSSLTNIHLYSSQYYASKEEMTPGEIFSFLQSHPVQIKSNAVVGGKHRVFAMIGRLISSKKYIPIYQVSEL